MMVQAGYGSSIIRDSGSQSERRIEKICAAVPYAAPLDAACQDAASQPSAPPSPPFAASSSSFQRPELPPLFALLPWRHLAWVANKTRDHCINLLAESAPPSPPFAASSSSFQRPELPPLFALLPWRHLAWVANKTRDHCINLLAEA